MTLHDILARWRGPAITGSRRRMIGSLAAGTLGVTGAHLSLARSEARKKGKQRKKRCPQPPRCPSSCTNVYHQHQVVGGQEICGIGHTFSPGCVQCNSNDDCLDERLTYPHCVSTNESLSSGDVSDFTSSCGDYAVGVCLNVIACIT